MARPMVVFDIDGTLIDTRPSFERVVLERSGATLPELLRFRATGGFNDDWELCRALCAWLAAGRPDIVERCHDLKEVLMWCGNDPGDLTDECRARYRGTAEAPGLIADEVAVVTADALRDLERVADVAVCTGRDRIELAAAEVLLGYAFSHSTTLDEAKKPDPKALLRLLDDDDLPPRVVFFGDTAADRLTLERASKLRKTVAMEFKLVGVRDGEAATVDVLADVVASLTPAT